MNKKNMVAFKGGILLLIFSVLVSCMPLALIGTDRSLDFYGQVIDQYGNPIPKVKITYSIKHAFGFKGGSRQTDKSGKFSITNEFGWSLWLKKFQKDGYKFIKYNDDINHKYIILKGSTVPKSISSTTPVLLPGWKIDRIATKYHQEEHVLYKFKPGEIYTINFLENGQKRRGQVSGDLRVKIERGEGYGKDRPSWRVRLESVNGGLLESVDPYPYLAPKDGYQTSWEYGYSKNAENYRFGKVINFYLKSRENEGAIYSHLKMVIDPIYNDESAIFITYFTNAVGKRVLYHPDMSDFFPSTRF